MMDVSRRKSVDVLRGYVRDADAFRDHAGRGCFERALSSEPWLPLNRSNVSLRPGPDNPLVKPLGPSEHLLAHPTA
jgi:hypothetical protein